jgi:hypothetical protein
MSWLKLFFSRRQVYDDLSDEIREHLEEKVEELVAGGMSRKDASAAARREFGNLTLIEEDSCAVWGWTAVESFFADLRYGLRAMRRNPGFSGLAILSLALGIGANTAIFSLINTLMLRMLPVRDPGQLVALLHHYPAPDEPHDNTFSLQTYRLMRDHNDVFSGLIASSYRPLHVRGNGLESQIVNGGFAEGSFFSLLGMNPALGRPIEPQDDQASRPSPVVVLSWALWKSRFNFDPAILGKKLIVDDVDVTIVGVAPRNFSGLQVEVSQDLWLPLAMEPVIFLRDRDRRQIALLGRLKPGVSMEQARAEMAVLYDIDPGRGRPRFRQSLHSQVQVRNGAGRGRSIDSARELCQATAGADGDCGFAAVDRLRQRGQHVACPRCGTTARNGGASLSGRWTLPPGSPGADGISASFCGG